MLLLSVFAWHVGEGFGSGIFNDRVYFLAMVSLEISFECFLDFLSSAFGFVLAEAVTVEFSDL